MGAGGGAPPVKGEDVMILIGSSIILIMLIMQTWIVPTNLVESDDDEAFSVKYDVSEGDIFMLVLNYGEIDIQILTPSLEWETFRVDESGSTNFEYTMKEDGVFTFEIVAIEDSEIEYSLSRGLIYDYGLYPLGGLILGFGILKRIDAKKDEPVEALLED